MFFQLLKFDETSKSSAFKVSITNLLLKFILTALLIGFVSVIFYYYEKPTALHVARLIWVEVCLNFLFLPFAVLLAIGVKKDKLKWIRIWIKAKVVQVLYIFLLNFVMQVYITASLNFEDGIIVLVYTLITEGFYLEIIIFMNNYCRFKEDEDKNVTVPEKDLKNFIIRF